MYKETGTESTSPMTENISISRVMGSYEPNGENSTSESAW